MNKIKIPAKWTPEERLKVIGLICRDSTSYTGMGLLDSEKIYFLTYKSTQFLNDNYRKYSEYVEDAQ